MGNGTLSQKDQKRAVAFSCGLEKAIDEQSGSAEVQASSGGSRKKKRKSLSTSSE